MHSDIDFEDPNYLRRPYHPFRAYGQSKTANGLFAVEYDRRYAAAGVCAFAVMPGVIVTPLLRHMTPELNAELGVAAKDGNTTQTLRSKAVRQGAATSIWAVVGA